MMPDFLSRMRRWWRGDRRQAPRQNAERTTIVNRQYAVAVKLSRKLGRPPEELLGYHIADRILSRREE